MAVRLRECRCRWPIKASCLLTVCSSPTRRCRLREAFHNDGPDIRSLAGDGVTLVYDQLGEIHVYDPASGQSHPVSIEIDADLPEVRPTTWPQKSITLPFHLPASAR